MVSLFNCTVCLCSYVDCDFNGSINVEQVEHFNSRSYKDCDCNIMLFLKHYVAARVNYKAQKSEYKIILRNIFKKKRANVLPSSCVPYIHTWTFTAATLSSLSNNIP